MKILNQTTRDVLENELPILKTPISELTLTSELRDESLIHLVQYVSGDYPNELYESMKMKVGAFKEKVYQSVQNTLHQEYWDLHSHVNDDDGEDGSSDESRKFSFKDMLDYLETRNLAPSSIDRLYNDEEKDRINFVRHVNYDFDVLRRYIVAKDDEINADIGLLWKYVRNINCHFDPEMIFTTLVDKGTGKGIEKVHESVNHKKNVDDTYCQMSIKDGNKISNEWEVPADGNLVVYGWLDSSEVLNNKAIPQAFCVLEAKIKNHHDFTENWEIIGAQPVIPAKTITYVGFTVPVHKNLIVRVRTGFNVGAKSGQYPNEQDGYDTLSNSTPNGFKCMVYSNKDYVEF